MRAGTGQRDEGRVAHRLQGFAGVRGTWLRGT